MSFLDVNQESFLIPLEEIKRATNDFGPENIIGDGGFGKVYKGQLSERWKNSRVAVKRKYEGSMQGENEFQTELMMISISHKNIISFIGYCNEENEMIIVYEYASNGSLEYWLRDPNMMCRLSWQQRLKICLGVAQGLRYLHSSWVRIIHRDVKSSNVLLDDNMEAKVSDFGLSRLDPTNEPDTQVHTRPAGTQFYLDPIYKECGILTNELDVYSFGVVLFEILSGMPVYCKRQIGEEEPQTLIKLVRRYAQEDEVKKITDVSISEEIDKRSLRVFSEIAYKCISHNRLDRPTMDGIIKAIEEALEFQIDDGLETLSDFVNDVLSNVETHQIDYINNREPDNTIDNEFFWLQTYEEKINQERNLLRSFGGFTQLGSTSTPTYIKELMPMVSTPQNSNKENINQQLPSVRDLWRWIEIKSKVEAEAEVEVEEALGLLYISDP